MRPPHSHPCLLHREIVQQRCLLWPLAIRHLPHGALAAAHVELHAQLLESWPSHQCECIPCAPILEHHRIEIEISPIQLTYNRNLCHDQRASLARHALDRDHVFERVIVFEHLVVRARVLCLVQVLESDSCRHRAEGVEPHVCHLRVDGNRKVRLTLCSARLRRVQPPLLHRRWQLKIIREHANPRV